ncbi:MAG: SufD family Fe-S cluster assembly protein [Candidatus Micrarchaeia archaeon]
MNNKNEKVIVIRDLPYEANELYRRHSFDPKIERFIDSFKPVEKRNAQMEAKINEYVEKFKSLTGISPNLVVWSDGYYCDGGKTVKVEYKRSYEEAAHATLQYEDKTSAFLDIFSSETIDIEITGNENFAALVIENGQPFIANFHIKIGEGASANILEWFGSLPGSGSLVALSNSVDLAAEAKCNLVVFHNEGDSTTVIGKNNFLTMKNALLKTSSIYTGGEMIKLTNTFTGIGEGAECDAVEIAFTSNEQRFDILSNIAAVGRRTKAVLESKAIAMDNSKCILKGFAYVDKNAFDSMSYVYQRGIILNSGANIDSLPEMKIESRNVKASHSSATAPIDKNKLFYMESRGIGEADATKLLIDGFLAESIAKLGDISYKKLALGLIENKFLHGADGEVASTTKDLWLNEGQGDARAIEEGLDKLYKYKR